MGVKVDDTEFAAIQIARDDFHGEWNMSFRRTVKGPRYLCLLRARTITSESKSAWKRGAVMIPSTRNGMVIIGQALSVRQRERGPRWEDSGPEPGFPFVS